MAAAAPFAALGQSTAAKAPEMLVPRPVRPVVISDYSGWEFKQTFELEPLLPGSPEE